MVVDLSRCYNLVKREDPRMGVFFIAVRGKSTFNKRTFQSLFFFAHSRFVAVMKRFLSWILTLFLLGLNVVLAVELFYTPYPPKALPYVVVMPQTYWWHDYRDRRADEALPPPLQAIVDDLKDQGHTLEVMRTVQRRVGGLLTYTDDEVAYGAFEYFASPLESTTSGKGDCDEYATLAYEVFRALGFTTATGLGYVERPWGGGHAVTLVELDGVLYVVDAQARNFGTYTDWQKAKNGLMLTYGDERGVHFLRNDHLN